MRRPSPIIHLPPAGTALAAEEFTRVFGPAGALDGFLNTRLKPFVDATTSPWTLRPGAPLTATDLALFQRTAAIRVAYFPTGPAVAFPVDLAPATPSRPATLTLGTVAIRTGSSVAHPALVTWPPPSGAEAALQTDVGLSLRETGFWALHRLVAAGRVRPGGKAGDTLTFGTGADTVSFTLRAPALAPSLLADLRCPSIQ